MPTLAQGVLERAPTRDVAPPVGSRRASDVQLTYKALAPFADLFHSRIDRTSNPGHWLWTGRFRDNGRSEFYYGNTQCLPSHASLVLASREDRPAGTLARRLCGETKCVHPEHWAWACDGPTTAPAVGQMVRARDLSWRAEAACADAPDPDIFYPDPLPPSASHEQRVAFRKQQEEALSYCARCTVRTQCGPFALEASGGYGIWASMPEKTVAIVAGQRAASRRAVAA